MHGKRVIVERAGRFFRRLHFARVGDHVAERGGAVPGLVEEPVEREQRKLPRRGDSENARRLQVGRHGHGVPAGIERLVNKRRRPRGASRQQLPPRRVPQGAQLFDGLAGLRRQLLQRLLHMEHILSRVVVHIPQLANIPIDRSEIQLGRVEHGARLVQGPGKVVAVVVEADVGVLRGVKAAALTIGHGRVQPADDLLRRRSKILADKALEAVRVSAQHLGVVVEHLLEVGNHPALIHAVAMKSARQLVVDAAAGHLFQSGDEGVAGLIVVAAHGHFQQQVQRPRVGKLGLRAEAAVARIEFGQGRTGDPVHQG